MNDSSDGTPAPDFDETKHAGICIEVLPPIPPHPTIAKPRTAAEISLRRHHTCPEEPLVFGQL